jgi:4-hydroxybenzoyl-CoA reductase subunit beta
MLPLPRFEHHAPSSLEEALRLLVELGPGARLVAGGTDLVPNMKHGLVEPEHLVSLRRVRELHGVRVAGGWLEIGATTALAEIAAHPAARAHAPALAEAMGQVGGPHHRRMGTLGGNVCLDTRCVYYNQTYFWREALGFCLKKDGTACHVVASGRNCVAAASNDSAPCLMALGAEIVVAGLAGEHAVPADDFYTPDGIVNTVLGPGEIVTRVRVPIAAGRRSAFEKLRRRGSIDFPLLNAAARIDFEPAGDRIRAVDLVVSALAARPKRVSAAGRVAAGTAPSDGLWRDLAEAAHKQCKPLTNLDNDPNWRREMVRVLVRRALARAGAADRERS